MKLGYVFKDKEYFIDVELEQFNDCFTCRHVESKLDIMFKKKYGDNLYVDVIFLMDLKTECYNDFMNKWIAKYHYNDIDNISFYTLIDFNLLEHGGYYDNFEPYGIKNEIMSSITDSASTMALLDMKIKSHGNYFETEQEAKEFSKRLSDKLASLNNEDVYDSKRGKFVMSQKEKCEKHGHNYEDLLNAAYFISSIEEETKISYHTLRILNYYDNILMHMINMSYGDGLTIPQNSIFAVVPTMVNEFNDNLDYSDPYFINYGEDYIAYFASREEAQKACEEIHEFFMENFYQMMNKDKQLKEAYERYKEAGLV